MGDMDGQVAIVSAGARGIGFAAASLLAARGATVVLNDVDTLALDSAAESLRGEGAAVHTVAIDAGTEEGARAVLEMALALRGQVHALVNAVGGSGSLERAVPRELLRTEWEDLLGSFRLNVEAMFRCTRLAAAVMCERGYGRIVNVSSQAGRGRSAVAGPAYAAAKAAVIGFTRQSSLDLAPFGVTINAVAPGLIFSERVRRRFEARSTLDQQTLLQAIPAGRAGLPNEPAAAIAFLCSPSASYISGAVIDVNGGSWVG